MFVAFNFHGMMLFVECVLWRLSSFKSLLIVDGFGSMEVCSEHFSGGQAPLLIQVQVGSAFNFNPYPIGF